MQWDLVESSPGDSSKGHARDRQKKTITLTARISKAVGLAGGLVFTQRRSVVDTGVPQGGRLGSGRRSVGVEPL
ncbi:hypothetical protein BHM03_00054631 [Ensete ventricosum]|nr:hypothetical protein BHM03_00054631 [Ensete ventricosum]